MEDLNDTLAAIRDALGCEPGDEVEAVRLVVDEHQRTIEAFTIAADVLDRVTVELGCVAGDDLAQAVRELKDECDRLLERDRDADLYGDELMVLAEGLPDARTPLRAAEALRRFRRPLPIKPGDVLNPADFGKGEAGVLRLAALLSEAPDGAAVSYMPECRDFPAVVLRKDGGCWDDSDGRHIFMWIARRAPLTVVAWPS